MYTSKRTDVIRVRQEASDTPMESTRRCLASSSSVRGNDESLTEGGGDLHQDLLKIKVPQRSRNADTMQIPCESRANAMQARGRCTAGATKVRRAAATPASEYNIIQYTII